MCGLFGFTLVGAESVSEEFAERGRNALATLSHRGPDQHGATVVDNLFLGHTRLSINDLSDAGRQPMTSADGQLLLTVNGEIYNFKTLRKDLGAEHFVSTSDSEVLLHGYRRYGLDDLLNRIDGMYAAVIYDRAQRRLSLWRDRVGIKPLHITRRRHKGVEVFAWASELKTLKYFFDDLAIDPTSILDFAAQRCIPAPKTIYKDVQKLAPATVCELQLPDGQFMQRRYWRLDADVANSKPTINGLHEQLRDIVDGSVAEQLVADVPVGLFLSGGLDSSILCESASRHVDQLRTYCIGFGVPERDETPFARTVAETCHTDHTERVFSADDLVTPFQQMNAWFDEPFGDLSAFPTAEVCKLARESSTVSLSGDGGDELFGGYTWYNRFWRFRRFNRFATRMPSRVLPFYRPPQSLLEKARNRLALLGLFDPLHLYAGVTSNLLLSELEPIRNWLGIEADYDYAWSMRPHYRPELGHKKALQFLDFHTWLPDDLLTKVDRVSMAVSLEVRVPFLKRELCEFAFGLPEATIYADDSLKGVLKSAYRQHLPESILDRDKRGFSVPVGEWQQDVLEGQPNFVRYYLQNLQRQGLEAAIS
jgi:asparagine synthase (glutamine-hydrolysing)